jgi:hypothetical protein
MAASYRPVEADANAHLCRLFRRCRARTGRTE